MEIPTMQQQTNFAQPPEMEASAPAGAESEPELDLETQEPLLLPLAPRQLGGRRRGAWAPIAAGVLALAAVAAFVTGRSPSRVANGDAVGLFSAGDGAILESTGDAATVSLALGGASTGAAARAALVGTAESDLKNVHQSLDGQAFMYLEPISAVAFLQPGTMVAIDPNNPARSEAHKVSVAHANTGVVRFEHALEHAFPESTRVKVVTDPAYEADWAASSNARMVRFSVPMYLGAAGEADSETPDTKVSLNQGCYQFMSGDEVELSSQHGHYEFNMVTGKTPEATGEDGKCELHLAYPVKYSHTPASEVSKMVDRTVGLNPTPAPVTAAPTAAPTEEPFDCDAGLENFVKGWSRAKNDYCCATHDKGCLNLKDISGCDTSGDGLISMKECRACDAEVLARFPELDADGDGKLSAGEIEDYGSLDSDGDGALSKAEVEGDEPLRGKFDGLDTDEDGELTQEEMRGEPDIRLVVSEVDFGRLASRTELLPLLPPELEGVLAGDLDNVVTDDVTVELSGAPAAERRRLAESGAPLLVSAWVDVLGDKSSIVAHREEEEQDVYDDLLCTGAHYVEVVDCCATEMPVCADVTAASVAEEGGNHSGLAVGGIGGVSLVGMVCFLVYSQSCRREEAARSEWADVEAVVVPGGGLSKDGTLVPWVQERLRRAHQIYQEVKKVGEGRELKPVRMVTMCEGIRHSSRDPRGNRTLHLESQLSADFLRELGVPASDIVTDDLSLDTTGNAYFLRTTRTDVFEARSLAVVTSEFHASRTKAIFQRVFQLGPFVEGSPDYRLKFEEVKNESIEPVALRRRNEWERQQLQDFDKLSKEWKDLHDVHAYIFSGEETNALPADQRDGRLPPSFVDMKRKNGDSNEANDNSNNNEDKDNTGGSSS